MSMFTRRHYVWLASVSRDIMAKGEKGENNPTKTIEPRIAVEILASALASESDGFNKAEFLKNVFCENLKAN